MQILSATFLALNAYISSGFVPQSTTVFTGKRNSDSNYSPRQTFATTTTVMRAEGNNDRESNIDILNRAYAKSPLLSTILSEEKLTDSEEIEAANAAKLKELMGEDDQEVRVYLSPKQLEISKMLNIAFDRDFTRDIVIELGFQHWQEIFTSLAALTNAISKSKLPTEVVQYTQESLKTIYLVKTHIKQLLLSQECFDQATDWLKAESIFYEALENNGNTLYGIEMHGEAKKFYAVRLQNSIRDLKL